MLTKEEFVKTHPDVRVGMTAYTAEGEKIGVIERIDEDELLVARGWFFHKDFMIPYDDIEDIRENRVIVRQRREDFEEQKQKRSESWDTGESDLTGRASEMGERAGARVEEEARIPVTEEEVEVTKRPVVKEEVRVQKEARTETEPVSGVVRQEEVKVAPSKPADKEKK